MLKIKHERTADCVVAGYRTHKSGDDAHRLAAARPATPTTGRCMSVGVIGAFPMARRKELFEELQPLVTDFDDHPWAWAKAGDGQPHADERGDRRWNAGKDLSFTPLRPERVVEVKYDHMEGARFRHTAQFVRWREDRDPRVVHLRPARGARQLRPRRRAGGRRSGDRGRPPSSRRAGCHRWRRDRAGRLLAAGALTALGAAAYFARRVLTPDRQRPDDTQILAVDDDSVTLDVTPRRVMPGRYGLWLDGAGGHVRLGEVLDVDEERGRVRRELLGVDFGHLAPRVRPLEPVLLRRAPGPVAGAAHRVRRRRSPSSAPCRPGWCRAPTRPTAGRCSSTAVERGATRACARSNRCTTTGSTSSSRATATTSVPQRA